MAEQNPKTDVDRYQWFVVQTYTGWEKRVKTTIEHRVELEGLASKLDRVLLPLKKMIEFKDGKPRDTYRNIMPGYVFIHMEPDENLMDIIQKVPGVSAFLGGEGKPSPLTAEEIDRILDAIRERSDRQQVVVKFRPGDQVRVVDGPFQNFIGQVEQVDEERGKLKVSVSIFGRATSVELDAMQVEDAVAQ